MLDHSKVHSRKLDGISTPHSSGASGLDGFVCTIRAARTVQRAVETSQDEIVRTETGEVSKLRGVIGHSTHHPVRRRLPHRVEHTKEQVEEDTADVWCIVYV